MYICHYILGFDRIFVIYSQLPQEFKERSYHLQKDEDGFHSKGDI